MRPHLRPVISGTTACASNSGAVVWTATNWRYGSAVISRKRNGCCQLPGRNVACPIPALLTRMSTAPNRPRACPTMSAIAVSRLRSASIVSRFASLPCSRAAAVTPSSPSRVRWTAATRMPAPSIPLPGARPMPPAAPVTIAARCVSLMPSSCVRARGAPTAAIYATIGAARTTKQRADGGTLVDASSDPRPVLAIIDDPRLRLWPGEVSGNPGDHRAANRRNEQRDGAPHVVRQRRRFYVRADHPGHDRPEGAAHGGSAGGGQYLAGRSVGRNDASGIHHLLRDHFVCNSHVVLPFLRLLQPRTG